MYVLKARFAIKVMPEISFVGSPSGLMDYLNNWEGQSNCCDYQIKNGRCENCKEMCQ